jgi:hypothetical protein
VQGLLHSPLARLQLLLANEPAAIKDEGRTMHGEISWFGCANEEV